MSSSPSKKHLSSQDKYEQDAAERLWTRGVLERNPISPEVADPSNTDVQLQLQLLLRNVGSRVRKSVTEGYYTPPSPLPTQSSLTLPSISPFKGDTSISQPALTSPLRTPEPPQDRVFASSRDILRSVYTEGLPHISLPSPKKRGRTQEYNDLSEDNDNEENNEEDRIDIDLPPAVVPLRAASNRAIKPLPFRLSQTRSDGVDRGFFASTAVCDDPFVAPRNVSQAQERTEMETCMELFKDNVKFL